ncbi:MAG: glycosyltransferase [bacterium]|nr:glycosyltransferase [bacterium]
MKKLLYFIPYALFPTDSGGKKRIIQNLKILTGYFDVTVAGFCDSNRDLELLRNFTEKIFLVPFTKASNFEKLYLFMNKTPITLADFYSQRLFETVKEILSEEKFDVIWINEIFMAQYLPDSFRGKKILDRQKSDSVYIEKILKQLYPGYLQRAVKQQDILNLKEYEKDVIKKFNIGFMPSERDLNDLNNEEKEFYKILPNTISLDEIEYTPFQKREKTNILIFGNWEYAPNIDGLEWFINEIFQFVITQKNEIIFDVIGKGAEFLRLERNANLRIFAYRSNLNNVLNYPGAMAVPLKIGGGTRYKILEGMASGIPIISTEIGVEGLGLEEGKHYLGFSDKNEFYEKLKMLCSDPEKIKKIINYSRMFIEENYSEENTIEIIEDLIQ